MRKLFLTKKKNGLSTIEVLVSFTLILLTFIVIMSIFSSASIMEKKSIDYTQASNYAATRLETIKKNTTTADDFNNIQSVSYMTLDNTNMFIYDIDVDSASTSLKQIGITIYYSNGNTTNPAPDSSKPNNGKILRLGTYLIKP